MCGGRQNLAPGVSVVHSRGDGRPACAAVQQRGQRGTMRRVNNDVVSQCSTVMLSVMCIDASNSTNLLFVIENFGKPCCGHTTLTGLRQGRGSSQRAPPGDFAHRAVGQFDS